MRDALDAGLDSLGVVGTGSVQNALDLVDLSVCPLLVHWSTIFEDGCPDAQQAKGNDGLLVDDVVLVAKGIDRNTGRGGEDRGLGDQRVAGERVKN